MAISMWSESMEASYKSCFDSTWQLIVSWNHLGWDWVRKSNTAFKKLRQSKFCAFCCTLNCPLKTIPLLFQGKLLMVQSMSFWNKHSKLVHSVASRLSHDTSMVWDHLKLIFTDDATLPKTGVGKCNTLVYFCFLVVWQLFNTSFKWLRIINIRRTHSR